MANRNNTNGGEVQLFEPVPDVVYTIDAVAHLAHVPRRTILIYCRHRLLSPVADPDHDGYYFDERAIRTLQRIEYLHSVHGINLAGTRMILELLDEINRLQTEMQFPRH